LRVLQSHGGCTYVAFHTQSCSFCVTVQVLDPALRVCPIFDIAFIVSSSSAGGIAWLLSGSMKYDVVEWEKASVWKRRGSDCGGPQSG
jgi:hypothetical protein